jgi:hypothetical protein
MLSVACLITPSTRRWSGFEPILARIPRGFAESGATCRPLSMELFRALDATIGVAAIFVLAGMILDSNYYRSTPEPTYVQGTVVDFDRPHRKQVFGALMRLPFDLRNRQRVRGGSNQFPI